MLTISDADAFFSGLQQRVETLEQTRRQNPLSVQLLVHTAKRYVAKPEHRIQLDDLITQETDRIVTLLDVPELAPQGSVSQQRLLETIHTYEGAAEALARIAGLLGRWGDNAETALVLDLIRTLCKNADKAKGGTVPLLELRRYPAVLVFTSYGLGLTVAQRWVTLHAFLSSEIAPEDREPKRMVDMLFLWAWDGGKNDLWNQAKSTVGNPSRRKTPLSDHLCSLFAEWGKSFTGLTPDFELMCERFEFLASLTFLESAAEDDLAEAMASNLANSFVWAPLGRVGWHSSNLDRLVKEIEGEPIKTSLLQAGFAKRNPKFLQLSVAKVQRMAGRMRWT